MDPFAHPFAFDENIDRANRIFQKLMRFAPDLLSIQKQARFRVDGYLFPLEIDILDTGERYRRISLVHCWFNDEGEQVPDPDIVISIYTDWELAEARIYKDIYSFKEAYPVQDGPADLKIHFTINNFLERWLDSLLQDEHVRRVCTT
jgi:uncharacterized protein YqiB (DUF1249 family)